MKPVVGVEAVTGIADMEAQRLRTMIETQITGTGRFQVMNAGQFDSWIRTQDLCGSGRCVVWRVATGGHGTVLVPDYRRAAVVTQFGVTREEGVNIFSLVDKDAQKCITKIPNLTVTIQVTARSNEQLQRAEEYSLEGEKVISCEGDEPDA